MTRILALQRLKVTKMIGVHHSGRSAVINTCSPGTTPGTGTYNN